MRGTLCKRSLATSFARFKPAERLVRGVLHAQLAVIVRNAPEARQLLGVHVSKLAKRTEEDFRDILSLPQRTWPLPQTLWGRATPIPAGFLSAHQLPISTLTA